jgi:putative copper resistance protein D
MERTLDLMSAIAAVRALHTGAALLLFGTLVFTGYVDKVQDTGPVGTVGRAGAWRSTVPLLCSITVAVSGIAWLGLEAAAMSGGPWRQAWDPSTLAAVLGSTVFGRAWLARAASLVAIGVLAARFGRDDGRTTIALVACSAALLAGLAWQGHANAQSGLDGVAHHLADAAHLLAAGAWVGGLPLFVARLGASAAASSMAPTARCIQRYGNLAAVCVGVLVASGAVNAAYTLRMPSLLFESDYGRLLLAKLALFGAMLAIAAVNRWRLAPKLSVDSPVSQTAVLRLRGLAWLELLVGVTVVILASVLATSAPPMRM